MQWFLMSLVGVPLITILAHGSRQVPLDDAPEIIVRLGERLGCAVPRTPLPGGGATWVEEREARTAYAAWCTRQIREKAVYDLLIATTSNKHPWSRCPSHVRLGLPEPFPHLRATMLPRDLPYPMSLKEFWYLRGDDYLLEDHHLVVSSGVPTGPALDFGIEDAGQILVCLRGRWIMGGYH